MSAIIVAGGIVALLLTGGMYYAVIPMAYNLHTSPAWDNVADPAWIATNEAIYNMIGIFPLLFVGAVFLNMYMKATRDHTQDVFG